MGPALIDELLAIRARADAAGHGHRGAIYADAARRLGISVATLHRNLKEGVIMTKVRKTRSDKGSISLCRDEALILSAYLLEHYRANNKKLSSIEEALTVLRENGTICAGRVDQETGEILPLSASAVASGLRHYGLHPKQLRTPTPPQSLRSLHPNHAWQIDASISVLYYAPTDGGLADMPPGEFYKNKPGNFAKISKQRLTRYVVTDHTSGAIHAWYVAGGESIAAFGDALLEAMRTKNADECPYGAPLNLMLDPGSGATKTFRRFLSALGITPLIHAPGNPRAKGQVEQAHNIVETSFEAGFKLSTVPNVEWINDKSRKWCRWYNATRVHSRTGKTRLAKWMEIKEQQLRIVNVDLARELLTREPKLTKVSPLLQVRFGGQVWDVSRVPSVQIGEKLGITSNPLLPGHAYAVIEVEGIEVLHAIPEIAKDQHGFVESGAIIGQEMRSPRDTRADTHRKEVERLAMGAATDTAAAEQRTEKALAFGGEIDPYRHLDNLPGIAVLPRRGTAHGPQQSALESPPLSIVAAARQLRAALGERWTPDHYARLSASYPAGVPEGDIDALIAEYSNERPTLKAINGGRSA